MDKFDFEKIYGDFQRWLDENPGILRKITTYLQPKDIDNEEGV